MGHFFSRAIKRFTQCDSKNQLQSQEQQEEAANLHHQQAQQQEGQNSRPIVQSIPVGQSIDSADYAALGVARSSRNDAYTSHIKKQVDQAAKDSGSIATTTTNREQDDTNKNEQQETTISTREDDENSPLVEEAVIKIQALVRGHLTRKALKDAQQQASTPAPNAIGQSQFDEESLIKNPPSAVFLPSSPLSTSTFGSDTTSDQLSRINNQSSATTTINAPSRVPPLESIAEDVETGTTVAASNSEDNRQLSPESRNEENRREKRKLSPINRSLAITNESRSDSLSPVPSEANASIDLAYYDTPASASIDIIDPSFRVAGDIASVLHHGPAPMAATTATTSSAGLATCDEEPNGIDASPRMVVDPPLSQTGDQTEELERQDRSNLPTQSHANLATIQNSHSIDSAEAAAIRIQSAFRGYHTRKHSPYRRRSPGAISTSPPTVSLDSALSNGNGFVRRSPLRQQNAAELVNDFDDGDEENLDRFSGNGERRDEIIGAVQPQAEERLSRISSSERRLSKQNQRLDSNDSQTNNSALQSTLSNHEGTLNSVASTMDGASSNNTCISLVAMEPDSDLSNQHNSTEFDANLTGQKTSTAACRDINSLVQTPSEEVNQNQSIEMDTESSILGAALSMNDDLSEGDLYTNQELPRRLATANVKQVDSDRDSNNENKILDGASLISDESEQRKQSSIERSIEDKKMELAQELELERASEELEAALEEAMDDFDGNLNEKLANAILNEEQQTMLELESDDIERRDPSGRGIEEGSGSPLVVTVEQQPALESQSSMDAKDSFVEQRNQIKQSLDSTQALGVESPDEAIGSGRSSPALISSNGGSGSSEEDEDEDVQMGTRVKPRTGDDGDQSGEEKRATVADEGAKQQVISSNSNNKKKRKNQNKKKGRK